MLYKHSIIIQQQEKPVMTQMQKLSSQNMNQVNHNS